MHYPSLCAQIRHCRQICLNECCQMWYCVFLREGSIGESAESSDKCSSRRTADQLTVHHSDNESCQVSQQFSENRIVQFQDILGLL
jgi:hypothetical protein